MDVRQLQYMVVLAETLHFGRAAEQMHIAQSAFSTQIARLERSIGAQLFDRSTNRVTLTQAGEVFLVRATSILREVEEASAEARTLHERGREILRVGLFCESAGELTPLIIAAYRRSHPSVDLVFQELSMIDQVDALTTEKVDVAFIRSPLTNRKVQVEELFAEPRYVGMSADNPLAERESLSTQELADQPFAVAAPEAPTPWRAYWACEDDFGAPARVAASVTSVNESLLAITYQGAVDTFPGSATRFLRFPGVVYRPLVNGGFSPVTLATRNGERRSHVLAFRKVAKQLATTALSEVPDAVPVEHAPVGTPRCQT
jgi:DNA-binding transcriptional LysR family regulator